ncbi:MAG: hypothetical protein J6O18_01200, partial [Bacilli bacterium]|nr:hypothetical protein [Bacilli bacterium]
MQSIIKTFPNGKRYGYIYESYRVGKGKDSTVRKRKVHEFGDLDELAKEHPEVKAYMDEVKARLESEKE